MQTPYIGVRKRSWEHYIAEIHDPWKNCRVCLGKFNTAEEAARAYDMAAREFHGGKAMTNFPKASEFTNNSIPSNTIEPPSPQQANAQCYKYDVFISFRGSDTRNTFVDHLYAHLTRKGIFAFKDDTRLEQGESISFQLLQAIKHSRVSIVVFSKNYATSTWCLDEMTAIAKYSSKFKRTVFPVFYDVDPSHVRNQNGVYENVFLLYTKKHNSYKVDEWRTYMTSLAGLAGWDVRNKPEQEEIEKIAQAVAKKLGHIFSGSADDLIGIQTHVEGLENLLKLSLEVGGSQILGIWGMGGIGKTTLATVLYDRISYQFDACCFIANVSLKYKDGGAIAVQKQIIGQTIEGKNLDTYSPPEISRILRGRLHNSKLLVILDDVDQIEQLQELHIRPKLLHAGSRIIITTRDEQILKEYGTDTIYETQLMNDVDAHELLCRKAFNGDNSSTCFAQLIPEVLKYAQRLPIAIIVMGSFLYGRSVTQWRATLDGLQNNPPNKRIMKVLQISYEGLEQREKEIFLHIACFFKGEREDYVWRILHACGLNPAIGLPLIVEKSLITIRNQEIHMHGMLQELGKQIVRRDHPDEPELWSRLWLHEDFFRVMTVTNMVGVKAKAIVLDQKEDGFKFNAENLSKMENLQLLLLYHKNFSGTPLFLSNSLRYLLWNGYPFDCLPSKFQPYYLVELNMPDSNMEQLWTGIQKLPYLKRMDLSNSKNLKVTPCFEGMQNLERLDFAGCTNLWHVHPSIGRLKELKFLSLQNCSSLVCLEFGGVSKLSSLIVMCLSGCTKLENTPDFTGALNLEYLEMDQCTSLFAIHKSIGGLAKLKFLSLRDCTNLVRFPLVCISNSPPLQCLIFLDLSFCNISEVPDAVGELRSLERLNLQGNNFSSIPSTIKRLSSLAYLNLSHCHRLEKLHELPIESSPSVGKYFETTSGSRDHRSGLYIFDCPKTKMGLDTRFTYFAFKWLRRLVKEPRHFRCGFDIVHPWNWKILPSWFSQLFNQGSIIKMKDSMNVDWIGVVFCVAFEVNKNLPPISGSPLPHPFYLSFESEHSEERFDMPLNLERHIADGKSYLWTIYISRDHCHFLKTGAHIRFKAQHGLILNQWGLGMLSENDSYSSAYLPLSAINYVEESSSSNSEPKIQLPYNWLISEEDEMKNNEAKRKEIDLFNQGFLTA